MTSCKGLILYITVLYCNSAVRSLSLGCGKSPPRLTEPHNFKITDSRSDLRRGSRPTASTTFTADRAAYDHIFRWKTETCATTALHTRPPRLMANAPSRPQRYFRRWLHRTSSSQPPRSLIVFHPLLISHLSTRCTISHPPSVSLALRSSAQPPLIRGAQVGPMAMGGDGRTRIRGTTGPGVWRRANSRR